MVIFLTGMADIILYNSRGYFVYVDIRREYSDAIGKQFLLTMRRMTTVDFIKTILSWSPYEEAVKKYGISEYDEFFEFEPLLSLGGNESVNNMKRVNMKVHLDIVSQLQETIIY